MIEEEDAAESQLPPQLRHEHRSLRGQEVLVDGAQEDEVERAELRLTRRPSTPLRAVRVV
jgi:hypothetical protein